MNEIYELISEAYEKCQSKIDGLEVKNGLEYETLLKLRGLQSQAADVILDYRNVVCELIQAVTNEY